MKKKFIPLLMIIFSFKHAILTNFPTPISPLKANKFVIVTASYNNKKWYQKNIDSIIEQTYNNWRLIYIDDCSTDKTGELVQNFINKHQIQKKVTLIHNKQRKGHLYNQYHAIQSCDNDEIIVIVDGDDWLANNNVLNYLNDIYQDQNIWMTYGQFEYSTGKRGFCSNLVISSNNENSIRSHQTPWIVSHLRTFYAGLYKKIHKKDLLYNNKFLPCCADLATMIPMLEMAGNRFKFINEILYVYNQANSLNFFKTKRKLQLHLTSLIQKMKPYKKINSLEV
jgi:glycosyltransferase involved in cell wall biosynthesis